MTCHTHPCGSLAKLTIGEVADRAARWILQYRKPHAVCIDPQGRVSVEPAAQVVESDLVGVYARELGLLGLARAIAEDLRFEAGERGLRRKTTTQGAP